MRFEVLTAVNIFVCLVGYNVMSTCLCVDTTEVS
jgi:hypothetical protein